MIKNNRNVSGISSEREYLRQKRVYKEAVKQLKTKKKNI